MSSQPSDGPRSNGVDASQLPVESIERFARIAAAALDIPIAVVMLEEWQLVVARTGDRGPARRHATNLAIELCRAVMRSDEALLVEDIRDDPWRPTDSPEVVAFAGAPLRRGDVVHGVLAVVDRRPRRFDAHDLHVLADIAAALDERLEAQARLHDLGHDLRSPLSVIQMGTALLLTEDTPWASTRVREILSRIQRNANQAVDLLTLPSAASRDD